ncbi:ferritin [Compostibacter hankyongensis]|uniref:Ferritin n=1 Tax=Compostibacter hankyongensis TaxID=1007089 RepID=A0ABP8FCX3_9BACT
MPRRLIPEKTEALLNKQMTYEANAAQFYLALGSWADAQGFAGIANFLYQHVHEERNHMMKLVKFINQRGGHCKVEALAVPPDDPDSLHTLFEMVLDQEKRNSAAINNIVDICLQEKDYPTFNFMQWYVKEQIEEEALATQLLDKMKVIGEDKGNKGGLYDFDQDIAKMHGDADVA